MQLIDKMLSGGWVYFAVIWHSPLTATMLCVWVRACVCVGLANCACYLFCVLLTLKWSQTLVLKVMVSHQPSSCSTLYITLCSCATSWSLWQHAATFVEHKDNDVANQLLTSKTVGNQFCYWFTHTDKHTHEHTYLQTSLPFEKVEDLMTSGAIQA